MKILTRSESIIDSLKRINIYTSEDVLNHLPFRYENNAYTELHHLVDKQRVTILGRLVSNPKRFKNSRVDIISFFFVTEDKHFFNCKMYNRGYMFNQIVLGEDYTIIGTYSEKNKEISIQSLVKGELPENKAIRSVYHLPKDLAQFTFRGLVERTYNQISETIIDYMPSYFKKKYRLLDRKEAIKLVHMPTSLEDIASGLRTLKYNECLSYCLKNQILRGENKRIPLNKKAIIDTKKINEFILGLSYKLTHDQIVAIREIVTDMNQESLMYRLLQGDVGTGKTIVAATALYANYLRNRIGAFMVPTDSLARQQYEELKKLFEPYNIRVGLLIHGLKQKVKNEVKMLLESGQIDVIVGTHALFSEDVNYASLGFVVIDEQHRFGVEQRNKLVSKDDGCDLLLMSATPIPRTLSLSIYGDLDISTLTEFPKKERNVLTYVLEPNSSKIYETIKECLDEKRQVFIVAPKIVGKDALTSAERLYELYSDIFPNQVRILHGRMKSEEKSEILDDFIAGNFLILVSTTVIELGINVLNAGAIIIYSAGSFGLASLHQLRGRVGRNGSKSTCLLVDEEVDNERLKVLEKSNDGFYIAEQDMKMRGPGDIIGTAQSGFPTFDTLNIVNDFKMFECARDDATMLLNNLSNVEFKKFYDLVLETLKCSEVSLFD